MDPPDLLPGRSAFDWTRIGVLSLLASLAVVVVIFLAAAFAFYDALETNDSAVKVLGEPELLAIARELTASVRANVTIDWTIRDNVRAQLRVLVKRILRKHGYPPDKQEKATQTVLEQAEVLSGQWVAA
jgi:hypothetical protein